MPRTTNPSQAWLNGLTYVMCLGTATCCRIFTAVTKGLARGD
ncbi:MAG: hypothetical protein QF781_00135 [Phycisphaerales bacterium]|nr:hypothetical protein [Phycisphaerales bacterium]MDP6310548.1 hypothetical protein [Phycisphaerales bacterium]MDP6478429.1 hypothetical protein [Phycisphaerales bacterium]MDP6890968.1 hypothetical protein [Phycisphaerales bacterium]MDP7087403.1 hypothetical protein [Phycisphaerales bacterium]